MQLKSTQLQETLRPPRTILRDLVSSGRTGELVCAHGACEVHIYLQSGRIAWGTDTEHPFAFGRRITETCGLTRERLATLVAECRLNKSALGEYLVRARLATREQVREALRFQASIAVRALEQAERASYAFLDRLSFASYDSALTFSLEELKGDTAQTTGVRALASDDLLRSKGAARQLFDALRDCEWSERWEGRTMLEHCARVGHASATPSALRALLAEGTVEVAGVRNGAGTILGAVIEAGAQSLYCEVRDEAPFGAVYATLARHCGIVQCSPQRDMRMGVSEARIVSDDGGSLGQSATQLMSRTSEIAGVCHLVRDHPTMLIVRADSQVDFAASRLAELSSYVFDPEVLPGATSPAGRNFGLRTAVVGDAEAWWFGTELSEATGESVWLATGREVVQGLGAACLAALVRELEKW